MNIVYNIPKVNDSINNHFSSLNLCSTMHLPLACLPILPAPRICKIQNISRSPCRGVLNNVIAQKKNKIPMYNKHHISLLSFSQIQIYANLPASLTGDPQAPASPVFNTEIKIWIATRDYWIPKHYAKICREPRIRIRGVKKKYIK